MPAITVLIPDDPLLVVEGLRNLLTVKGFEVVGTASDGLQAVHLACRLRPDIVLLDVRMPTIDGLEALKRLKAEAPDVKVVVLTSSEDDDTLMAAIKGGAAGYLHKSMQPDLFVALLAGVVRGEAALMRETAVKLMEAFARQSRADHAVQAAGVQTVHCPPPGALERLTSRQREILFYVADGLGYKEIAAALHISKRTVQYHVTEIMQKLGLENRNQMMTFAAHVRLEQEASKSS